MNKSQIKFKNLTEDQTIQMINLNDYFDDAVPTVTKPITKKQFIKKHLQEIVNEEECTVDEAFKMCHGFGDGDSNAVFVTVVDGAVKVVLG